MNKVNERQGKSTMQKWSALVTILLIIVFTVVSSMPAAAYAKSENSPKSERKTVRVGWYESEFNHKDKNDHLSGYAYEYQQKIAAYTGWDYEYVEGDWYDLLHMLENGEIDMLSDVSYTEERGAHMLFSAQPMGEEQYVLLVSAKNDEIRADDFSTLNGKTVGVAEGNVVRDLFTKWVERNGVDANVVTLTETQEEQAQMLRDGAVDAIVDYSAFHEYMNDSVAIAPIGTSDFYFALNKNKPELKNELDSAMNLIFTQNKNYNRELDEKYISDKAVNRYLTADERKWVKEHGKIRIGYKDDYLPYSGTSGGGPSGLLKNITDKFSNIMLNANIDFEFVPYESTEEAIKAVKKGDIDLAYPVMYGDYEAEKAGLLLSDTVAESKIDALIRTADLEKFDTEDDLTVATVKGDTSQRAIVRGSYENWKIKTYATIEDCLYAVERGQADCFVVCDYRVRLLDNEMQEHDLSMVGIDTKAIVSFAADDSETELISITNKLIGTLNDLNVTALLAHYATKNREVGLAEFARDNLALVASVVALIGLLSFLLTLFIWRNNRRLRATNKAIDQKNEELVMTHEELERSLTAEKYSSEHDALTGLRNRRMYEAILDKLSAEGKKEIYLISMDVNGLKHVNDNLGHNFGDELIVGAAKVIKETFGEFGKCYRIGGDEFASIIIDQDVDMDSLRKRLKQNSSEWKGSGSLELAISMGASRSTATDPKSVKELLEYADVDMYADKRMYYSNKGNDRRVRRNSITKSELSNRIAELKSMFEIVRMVDVEENRAMMYDANGDACSDNVQCYGFWGRDGGCENCISAKAMQDHRNHSKFEVKDGDVYFITAQYLIVDGSPVLLEVIHKLEDVSELEGMKGQNIIEAIEEGAEN